MVLPKLGIIAIIAASKRVTEVRPCATARAVETEGAKTVQWSEVVVSVGTGNDAQVGPDLANGLVFKVQGL